jgi:enoyl-CoA hydratase
MSDILLIADPAPHVRRLTLNRPDKRNALSNEFRAQVFGALEAADTDPEVRVTILRGAGSCFSAGYDLGGGAAAPRRA